MKLNENVKSEYSKITHSLETLTATDRGLPRWQWNMREGGRKGQTAALLGALVLRGGGIMALPPAQAATNSHQT